MTMDERMLLAMQQDMALDLRDRFAMAAIPAVYADYVGRANKDGFDPGWRYGIASDAYALADAMMSRRAK